MRIRRLLERRNLVDSRLWLAGLLALGCGQILDISEPKPRPPPSSGGYGGQAAQPSEAGSANQAAMGGAIAGTAEAGEAGALGGSAGESGASGESNAGTGEMSGESGAGTGGNAGGGAGFGPIKLCALEQQRCDPDSPKTPQVCNAFGQWLRNSAEGNDLDCATECDPSSGKCVECEGSETTCNGNYLKTCVNGAWSQAPQPCAEFCKQGACVNSPSCVDPAPKCGADSCCLSLGVDGGTFARDGDAMHMATISSFSMDKYEVTVSRFARFVNWYYGPQGIAPATGSGKSPHIAEDPGWDANYPLPATLQDMQTMLSCVGDDSTSDPTPTFLNADQSLPANCMSFYVAYAFCIWDGGRLPTEAEWNYAATGGSDQRYYPWSDPPSSKSIDATRAVYSGSGGLIKEVGSAPPGNGRFGQADLAGNVSEWTLDYYAAYPNSCSDCLNTTVSSDRSTRGGNFSNPGSLLKTAQRISYDSVATRAGVGFRCVHDL